MKCARTHADPTAGAAETPGAGLPEPPPPPHPAPGNNDLGKEQLMSNALRSLCTLQQRAGGSRGGGGGGRAGALPFKLVSQLVPAARRGRPARARCLCQSARLCASARRRGGPAGGGGSSRPAGLLERAAPASASPPRLSPPRP